MSRFAKKRAVWGIGVLALVVIMMVVMAGCGGDEETTTTAAPGSTETTMAPESTETTMAPESTETTVGEMQPVSGGVLKLVHNVLPADVGYWPLMGPTDEGGIFPGVERIMKFAPGRVLEPDLAVSVVEDPDALTITVELNKGVMFHDGTELTASVAKWNYDLGAEGGKLQFADAIKEFEIVDDYNYVIHLNYWHNQLLQSLGWVPMFSQAAYEANGGQEWAMTHLVGTGPFILTEYDPAQKLVWEKNPNYWREGQPYLDGIETSLIPDPATASAIFESGQADIWQTPDAQAQSDLASKGYKLQSGWAGFQWHLMPNTVDPASPLNDIKVREALEYALDKPAIGQAVGYGLYVPLYEVSPPGEWGSGAAATLREYDPEKAKQLLVDAGYPDGCPIDLLALAAGGSNTDAEAIKGYLDAAGFVTNIDLADPGRFYGSVFGTGWKDVALMFSGNDYNYLMSCNAWWGPQPKTNLASFQRPPEFAALFEPANQARTEEEQIAATEKIVAMMADQALMVPVYHLPAAIAVQDYVHTEYPMEGGFVAWSWNTTWMDAQ